MKTHREHIHYEEYDSPDILPEEERLLIQKAEEALQGSYSPYSRFAVGAAVLLENGKIITGSNQENASYPVGVCAESLALFYASHEYPGVKVKALAVTAKSGNPKTQSEPVKPCGACRQVIAETESRSKESMKIILKAEKGKTIIINGVKNLLPLGFSGEDL